MLPDALPTLVPSTPFSILSTKQFDYWQAVLNEGISNLQEQLYWVDSGEVYSPSNIYATVNVLLNVGKSLTAFLATTASVQSTTARSKGLTRAEHCWAVAAIIDLRMTCHKYSFVVLQLVTAMQQRIAKSKRAQMIMAADTWWNCTGGASDSDEGMCTPPTTPAKS